MVLFDAALVEVVGEMAEDEETIPEDVEDASIEVSRDPEIEL